jgi:hypothetical protein
MQVDAIQTQALEQVAGLLDIEEEARNRLSGHFRECSYTPKCRPPTRKSGSLCPVGQAIHADVRAKEADAKRLEELVSYYQAGFRFAHTDTAAICQKNDSRTRADRLVKRLVIELDVPGERMLGIVGRLDRIIESLVNVEALEYHASVIVRLFEGVARESAVILGGSVANRGLDEQSLDPYELSVQCRVANFLIGLRDGINNACVTDSCPETIPAIRLSLTRRIETLTSEIQRDSAGHLDGIENARFRPPSRGIEI